MFCSLFDMTNALINAQVCVSLSIDVHNLAPGDKTLRGPSLFNVTAYNNVLLWKWNVKINM